MQLHKRLTRSLSKAALASAALAGLLFAGPSAQAADRRDCERRIARTERHLRDAIEDHGYYSRQANHWRHERREAYQRCRRDAERFEHRYNRDHDRDWYRDRY